jgi:galactokinase
VNTQQLTEVFEHEFDAKPAIFRAPGRVNLIGEHTDYNDGFVLPSAIGFYTYVAISPRKDKKLVFRSTSFEQAYEVNLDVGFQKLGAWCDYILGVAVELTRMGIQMPAANLLVHGEVPMGSGLSSSAALEVASAMALLHLAQRQLPMKDVAKLCQRAENNFVGARVGIMDQFASGHGQRDSAVLLDCRSLDYELVEIPGAVKFVICNTMVKHEHSGGEYNARRQQCEEGVQILAKEYPGISALRDVNVEQLQAAKPKMPELIYKRCLHVVNENQRVLDTAHQLRSGNLKAVGALMRESHNSLRDLYEVSCPELDAMVEAAQGLPGFIGGRMTGGGFGGCTVNLVEQDHAAEFAEKITQRYVQKTGIRPDVYICSAADGAGADETQVEN